MVVGEMEGDVEADGVDIQPNPYVAFRGSIREAVPTPMPRSPTRPIVIGKSGLRWLKMVVEFDMVS